MNKKFIIAGLAGGVAYFLLGGLFYGKLLKDVMTSWEGTDPIKMKEMPDMLPLVFGNMFMGFFIAYVFSKWAQISSFKSGLIAGAIIGLFIITSFDLTMFGISNTLNATGMIMDIALNTFMLALVGGVVGLVLGMIKDPK